MAGFDTTDTIGTAVSNGVIDAFGQPTYWLRYFHSHSGINLFEDDPNLECDSAWDSRVPGSSRAYIGPIHAPNNSDLGLGYDTGNTEAYQFATAMHDAWNKISGNPGVFVVPAYLVCWLDQEPSSHLTDEYWSGWSDMINGWNWNHDPNFLSRPHFTPPLAIQTTPMKMAVARHLSPDCASASGHSSHAVRATI
jgi:hypothetical protein